MEKEEKHELKNEFEKEKLLSMSEISLWLDNYDDIFSDFDPRSYSERSVSIDFLDEIKRASRDKETGAIELRFLIPKNLRSAEKENQIKKRLHEHFKRHHNLLEQEKKKTVRKGLSIAGCGFASMFLAVFVKSSLNQELLQIALSTLLEPAGWFMMFFGLDMAFGSSKEKQAELDFYHKMSQAEISFISY